MSLSKLHEFELQLVEPCLQMLRRGLRVDEAKRREMLGALDAELTPLKERLNALVAPSLAKASVDKTRLFAEKWTCQTCRNGKKKRLTCEACAGQGQRVWLEYNPSSEKQTKVVLYDLLKLPKRTKGGKLSSDEDDLKGLLAHDTSGVVKAQLRYKKCQTMRGAFERIAPGEDGRIRTWYNIAGTETGRFSSAETFLERSTNLQNLANKVAAHEPLFDVRRCIVPDEGEVFLYADLSQAEARIVAALSGDERLLEMWSDPSFDIHAWTAAAIFGKDVTNVSAQERFLGKVARHALNYGMGWNRFLQNVNADADITGVSISASDAKRIVAAYHHLHPRLEAWWRKVATCLDTHGHLETVFGRRRTFFGRRETDRWLDHTHKEAIAFEPQATVADLLNRGLLRYWRHYDNEGAVSGGSLQEDGPMGNTRHGRLLAQVHDAVLVSVPEEFASREATHLCECLEEEIEVAGTRLTVPCNIEVGRTSWAELESLEETRAAA